MKQKTIYIIMIVCCLSLYSSAKQAGKGECPNACKLIRQKLAEKEAQAKEEAKKSYDLSPLQLFMFSI
jgi:hypothetical protein